MLAERGVRRVVLERKMTVHERQVNAHLMSVDVSNSQWELRRRLANVGEKQRVAPS
jgi:hypothetical protein